jgi:hypothetical protein
LNFSEDLEVGTAREGRHLEQELPISESANQLLQITPKTEAIAKFDNNNAGNFAW